MWHYSNENQNSQAKIVQRNVNSQLSLHLNNPLPQINKQLELLDKGLAIIDFKGTFFLSDSVTLCSIIYSVSG